MKFLVILFSTALLLTQITSQYSEAMGFKSLYYSGAAYCQYDTITNWTCGLACAQSPPLTDIAQIVNEDKHNFAYVGYNSLENEIILAFRGTNGKDLDNWNTNFQGVAIQYPGQMGAKVHSGFYNAYQQLQSKYIPALQQLAAKYNTTKIFITGYSLGGALALLAALDLAKLGYNNTQLFTFGQPRVGNQAFASYAHSLLPTQYFRIVHAGDMVPHMPPRISGFRHAGNEIWYPNTSFDSKYIECEDSSGSLLERKECSNSLLLNLSLENHKFYLGQKLSGNCNIKQPTGTQTKGVLNIRQKLSIVGQW